MFKTIGICGTGNMGRAIVKGLAASGLVEPGNILLYNIHSAKAQALADETGASVVCSAAELAERSQGLIMAVKPHILPSSLEEVRDYVKDDTVIISIAAGLTLDRLAGCLPERAKIVRVMPNTPSMVGEGMASVSPNAYAAEDDVQAVLDIFRSFGKAEIMEERLIDAVCGVSGSAPAYVYMFIEALADGAVLEGMPRHTAYTFAAQTVLGAAKMVLESGMHPGKLKDDVCSPGGTTIEAVLALEQRGFRAAVAEAVIASAEKNKTM